MTKTPENNQTSKWYPSEIRCSVYGNNQFQLPAILVGEVGFKSSPVDPVRGAKAAWYYHPGDDKVVLADDTVDRSSLEPRGSSRLSEISNDDLESGDVSGARVTIINRLPDHLLEKLTRNSVVLKPIYSWKKPQLNTTCVSVYPEKEYDNGELSNVDRHPIPRGDEEESPDEVSNAVGDIHSHANSV